MIPLLPVLELLRGFFGIARAGRRAGGAREDRRALLLLDRRASTRRCRCSSTSSASPIPSGPRPALDAEARQRRLLGADRSACSSARSRARARRDRLIEDLHWIDGAHRGVPGAAGGGGRGHAHAAAGELPARVPRRAGCSAPTTSSCRCGRSGRRRSTSCCGTCSATIPSLAGLGRADPRAHGGQPLLHRGGRAVAGRVGEARGQPRALSARRSASSRSRSPPPCRAVLAARIDRLGEREKQVLQRCVGDRRGSPGVAAREGRGASGTRAGGGAAIAGARASSSTRSALPGARVRLQARADAGRGVRLAARGSVARACTPRWRGRSRSCTRRRSTSRRRCWRTTGSRRASLSRRPAGTTGRPSGCS